VSRRRSLLPLLLLHSLVLAGAPAATPELKAEVRWTPPSIHYQEFEKGQPPAGILTGHPNELRGCYTPNFHSECEVSVSAPDLRVRPLVVTVDKVTIIVKLEGELWLETGAPDLVKEHEETHRAIAEYYYGLVPVAGQELADSVLGRKMRLKGREINEASHKALDRLNQAILQEYKRLITDRCAYAQKRFDEITDHGRLPISSNLAMQQCLEEEKTRWEQMKDFPEHVSESPLNLTTES